MMKILNIITVLVLCLLQSCTHYLDVKPDAKLAVPSTLNDLQALLDDYNNINARFTSAGEISCGDWYLPETEFNTISAQEWRNLYTWQRKEVFPLFPNQNDWELTYSAIYKSNAVLDALQGMARTNDNSARYDDIKGQALFLRALRYFSAAQVWAYPYDPNTAADELGLPLRLNSNFNETSIRSTLSATYEQILNDVQQSIELLPTSQPFKVRADKAAAMALIARVCLVMQRFDEAANWADKAIGTTEATLIDFNVVNVQADLPFERENEEVLFDASLYVPQILQQSKIRISEDLLELYEDNDLRKDAFYLTYEDGSKTYKGSYSGSTTPFYGIALNELYLIRAEANARTGNGQKAADDINVLLEKRYRENTYHDLTVSSQDALLERILLERRKELKIQGMRWMDLRRLFVLGQTIILERQIGNNTYRFSSSKSSFTIPIPEDIIDMTGMQQN